MRDKELIYRALDYWANHVETGVMTLSREDAVNCRKLDLIKDLNNDQMEQVRRLRKLATQQLERADGYRS